MTVEVIATIAACAAWLLLTWYTMLRPQRNGPRAAADSNKHSADIAIVYASQTGTAIELAQQAAAAFGERAALISMDRLAPEQLAAYDQALFIVSTYGEGDPPDMAHTFYERMRAASPEDALLQGLQTGVLALGDSSYRHYCGFGMTLDTWLQQQGAVPLFDTLRVDRNNPATLSAWADQLSRCFQVQLETDIQFSPWKLASRTALNPGGLGRPCHELQWQAQQAPAPQWQAGDIVKIQIGNSGEHREYSIASTPSEGTLRLLVRAHQRPDGSEGMGSHWLTKLLATGADAQLHIRANPLFRVPDDGRPAIFIGNGTGIAGLRALLQERIERGHHENWLVFGERQRAVDFHWGEHFKACLQQGLLAKMDLAFSRDQPEKRYVHHLLHASAATLRDWVARGAVIYVCGSKDGMAQDVDQALRKALGAHGYEALLQRQGYRRDVY